jgi:hypothetical protein
LARSLHTFFADRAGVFAIVLAALTAGGAFPLVVNSRERGPRRDAEGMDRCCSPPAANRGRAEPAGDLVLEGRR